MSDPPSSIFIGVMGAPYESELSTTVLRLVDAAIAQGHHIVIWTCGGATSLTQRTLGVSKPRNLLELTPGKTATYYPSTAALIQGLLFTGKGRLRWYVCRHCMEERGTTDQIAEVEVKSPFRFLHHLEQADKAMILGVK